MPKMSTTYPFPVPTAPSVAIAGSATRYPVHRIYCVGRNYADHAREMGSDPDRELPFFFTKPADAVVADGATIAYALATSNLHHEIELVVALGKGGVEIPREAALEHVYGYAAGLDMTRRDLQLAARDKGRPWDVGKAFDESAPIGAIQPAAAIGHPQSGAIRLTVNGEPRQSSDLKLLLWPVADLIADLSKLFALQPGDLIYTGTPAGVGPVRPGDELQGSVDGVGTITIRIGDPSSQAPRVP
jgi:fumarylpyruvate hydrolase